MGTRALLGLVMVSNPNSTSGSSRLQALVCVFLFIAAGIAVVGAIGSPEGANINGQNHMRQRVEDNAFHLKIAPWVIQHIANGQQAEFFVVLADQADLSGAVALATK